jgi:antirestriction protein ArdC
MAKKKKTKSVMTNDEIRKNVVQKIVDAINKGCPPWRQPWSNANNVGFPCNVVTKHVYRGINPLILMAEAMDKGYKSCYWGSWKQWISYTGGHPRLGEFATSVVFFMFIPKRNPATGVIERDGQGREKKVPLLRLYPVYHVEQLQAPDVETLLDGRDQPEIINGLLGQYTGKARRRPTTQEELLAIARRYLRPSCVPKNDTSCETIARAINEGIDSNIRSFMAGVRVVNTEPDFEPMERLMKASGAKIRHGGDKAFYRPKPGDFIQLPPKSSFDSMMDYYQTAAHELIHWTEDEDRVGRVKNHSYQFGELVAEIGSCFVMMEIGVPLAEKMLPKSQSYLKHWLDQMGSNPKYLFEASTQASKCVDYLLAFIGKKNPASTGKDDDSESSDERKMEVA